MTGSAREPGRRLTRFAAAERAVDQGAADLGNGLDDGVMLGPLVNADTRDKVKALVEDAVGKGASVLTGGKVPTGPGYFYPATVLDKVPDSAAAMVVAYTASTKDPLISFRGGYI